MSESELQNKPDISRQLMFNTFCDVLRRADRCVWACDRRLRKGKEMKQLYDMAADENKMQYMMFAVGLCLTDQENKNKLRGIVASLYGHIDSVSKALEYFDTFSDKYFCYDGESDTHSVQEAFEEPDEPDQPDEPAEGGDEVADLGKDIA